MNQFRALLAATDNLADAATAAASNSQGVSPRSHTLPLPQQLSASSAATGYARNARHSFPGAVASHDGGAGSSGGDVQQQGREPLQPAAHAAAVDAAGLARDAGGGITAAMQQLHGLTVQCGSDAGLDSSGPAGATPSSSNADSSDAVSQRSSSPFAGASGAFAPTILGLGAPGKNTRSSGILPGAIQGPLELLGELMLQAHASYSTCGLGSDGTNRLVNIVRQHMMAARRAGVPPVLYGAKITGGGSGGTVCVLGLSGPAGQAAVDAVVAQYREETGYQPFVFSGSSMGAVAFGHLRLKLRQDGEQ